MLTQTPDCVLGQEATHTVWSERSAESHRPHSVTRRGHPGPHNAPGPSGDRSLLSPTHDENRYQLIHWKSTGVDKHQGR